MSKPKDPSDATRLGLLPPSRPGSFNNQGATTTGKIVKKGFSYSDKETDEMRFGSRFQQEKHHWVWDKKAQVWRFLRTTLGSPNI